MLVRAEINGKPAVLIVDTGSNRTIVSSELADVRLRTLKNAGSTSKGSGLTGTGVFATATLRVGPITWSDHRILAMDLNELSKSFGRKIDGMLGMDFMSEFELVVVDGKHHKLVLSP
jgi:predicted aspartyl protease